MQSVMTARTIFQAGHGAGKTQRLASAARDALRAGTSASEILALAPRSVSAAALRDRLHGLTGQDIPTATVRAYALRLLAEDPAAAGLPAGWGEASVLSGIDRRLLIRHAWSEVGSASDSLWTLRGEQPGALEWVGRLFDRLSQAAGTADPGRLPALAIEHAGTRELWLAYARYLELCRRLGVVAFAEVENRAADLLRRRPAWPRPALLLLDDLDLFQPDQLHLAHRLAGVDSSILGACSDAPDQHAPLAAQRALSGWAQQLHLVIEPDGAVGRLPAISAGEYTSPDEEAEAIARHIAAGGHSPADYAVVLFDPALLPVLRRALRSYGLRTAGAEARDAMTLAVAPWARAGLSLLAGSEPAPSDLLALLSDPALGLGGADAHVALQAARDGALRLLSGTLPEGLSPRGQERLRALGALAGTVQGTTSERLRRWLVRLRVLARCEARTEAALGAEAAAVDRRLWQRWLGFLQRSEELHAALGTPLAPADAAAILDSAQALVEPEEPPGAPAVAVWQPGELGGHTAQTVFVAGLHEGALPPPLPPLPFADHADRSWGALPHWTASEADDRRAAWARGDSELRRAIGRAYDRVHLSYSRADRDGRRRLASPLLAAAIGAGLDQHGRLVPGAQIAVETGSPDVGPAISGRPQLYVAGALLDPPLELPDLVPDVSPFRTSPSALEDYFTCPRRCYFARELGLYDVRSSPRQALGMAVHHALDDLLAEGTVAGSDGERAAELVARYWIDDERRWGSPLRRDVFRRMAERAVANVARYEAERGADRFVAAELPFEWAIDDVLVNGRIDRIDRDGEGLHVVDYKLGRESPSIATLLAEFVPPPGAGSAWRPGDVQLPVYTLALEAGAAPELEAERVADVTLVYPLELYGDNGKPSVKGRRELRIIDHQDGCPACEQPPARWTGHGLICRRQLAQIRERLLEAVSGMRRGEWPADPRDGAQTCAMCAFRPICSEAR